MSLKIGGMSCQHCVGVVKTALEGLAVEALDVQVGSANFKTAEPVGRPELADVLDELGFDLTDVKVIPEQRD